MDISPDKTQATNFLAAIAPNATRFTFQTFDDNAERKNKHLAQIMHGTLDEHWSAILKLNMAGAGIFVTINETDGIGRTKKNIKSIRAQFADHDTPATAPYAIPPHILVASGGKDKKHAYWRVENVALDDFPRNQAAIANAYGSDSSVKDTPRVMRLPGTLHNKREPTLVRLLETREGILNAAEIETLIRPSTINEGSRNTELTKLGGALRREGFEFPEINAALQAMNKDKCKPPLHADEVEGIARSVSQYDIAQALLQQNLTQANVALVFVNQFAGKLLYPHRTGKWFFWADTHWQEDTTRRVGHFVGEITKSVNRAGKASAATYAFYSGVESILKTNPAFARVGDEFDRDNYLLNTPDWTYDLRNFTRHANRQEDLITKITSVTPTSEGGKYFLPFMNDITGGDAELISYHQLSLGACLSGAIESHWMIFWTGGGRNGKNTLGDLVMYVMGSYARKIPAATLLDKIHESHPTEIAMLDGVRLAVSSEVSQGSFWHETRINELTGDAVLTGRYMRQDFFEFERRHKHLIFGNHRPQLRTVNVALQSRIKIVPFKQCFEGREDFTLPDKLKQDAGFVLNWLIEGHRLWIENGRRLPKCAAVDAETKEYFSSQSTTEMWLAECCVILPNDTRKTSELPTSSELYASYSQWKKDRGEMAISQTRWSETMKTLFVRDTTSKNVRYRGLMLIF